MYKGKKILIIGGTGTIGRHLTRSLLAEEPKVVRIFSRDEHKQYEMANEFKDDLNCLRFLIGDIRDRQRLERAMEDVDYVFHLAAMKHVPSCEYNPFEAVQTNVIGTQNVIQAAIFNNVEKVLFTSTDKSISPANTYGATKLMAERLISVAEYQKGSKHTIFSSVRFGNVMGSRGSVIPLFQSQLKDGLDLTITDPDMLRYMMTPSQAIKLILEANTTAKGGEVFVLKMPVIRIGDLADTIIEIYKQQLRIIKGSFPKVKVIGLRPGEKRYEELMTVEEQLIAEERDTMYVIPSSLRSKNEEDKVNDFQIDMKPIARETLKYWLIEEKLI